MQFVFHVQRAFIDYKQPTNLQILKFYDQKEAIVP